MPETSEQAEGFVEAREISMLMTKEQSNAIRTLRGWAIGGLRERVPSTNARAKDRANPHARERAFDLAFHHKRGVSASELRDVLEGIGDTCPECAEGDCTAELDPASFASLDGGGEFSRQDSQRWRPHVTIQNKVAADEATRLLVSSRASAR